MLRGFLAGTSAVVLLSLCLWSILSKVAQQPSRELLLAIAGLGGTFLIAYAIEMSAIARSGPVRDGLREELVGGMVGVGAVGLVGIILSLGLSERAAVEHWLWADDFAFSLVTISLVVLGLTIVLLPLFAYERRRLDHFDPNED